MFFQAFRYAADARLNVRAVFREILGARPLALLRRIRRSQRCEIKHRDCRDHCYECCFPYAS
jgi:hypothetical protein